MLGVSQSILREIAEQESLKHPLMQELFISSRKEIGDLEEMVIQDTQKHLEEVFCNNEKYKNINFEKIARRTWEIIPLILEREALTHYIQSSNRIGLREKLPELSNAREGILHLQRKHPCDCCIELELIEWTIDRFNQDLPLYPKLGHIHH
ncbi:MAG: hypothetical protein ACEPOZ_11945 [Marinifilaceae bacterium]